MVPASNSYSIRRNIAAALNATPRDRKVCITAHAAFSIEELVMDTQQAYPTIDKRAVGSIQGVSR